MSDPTAGTAVSGGACGYYSHVGLFGGPPTRRGCGQAIPPGDATSASPAVELPPGGSAVALTATDDNGVLARYGPAVILGGRQPTDPGAPDPPSGPLRVSTRGRRSVTSSASVKNVGPGPFTARAVRSTCTASRAGVSAATTISNGALVTATDTDGNAVTTESIPSRPPVNYTRTGKTGNGDDFRAVFNEQMTDPDGTISVNAVHLYLLGPTAFGDVVIARSFSRA